MLNETHQLSFGCSGLAGLYQPVSDTDVEEVLNAAWDSGIRYFDTARITAMAPQNSDWVSSYATGRAGHCPPRWG